MKYPSSLSLFALSFGLLLTGCQTKTKGPVVAHVGSINVTLDEIQRRLRDTPPAYQQYVGTSEGRKQYLQLILREKTVLAKAQQDGIAHDASYEKEIEKFKEHQAAQLSDYKDTLLVESYLRKLRSNTLGVTDAEVQAYFDAHQEFYSQPQEIMASHILLNTREDAETVLARLKNGESFEKLAHELSRDPSSAAQGGHLAPFRHGTLVPEFEAAAFALKKGQISNVVQTQFGFHIIKKLGQVDLPPRTYADAKEEIRRQLERAKFDQWVTKQESELGVKVDESMAALLSVQTPGPTESPAGDPAQETPKS
jgi:peptidyl-prolyl cis-trans isomerase C